VTLLQPLRLDRETVKAACRAAYEEKRLGYQHPRSHDRHCQYRYPDGNVCSIGAAVPGEYARIFDNHTAARDIEGATVPVNQSINSLINAKAVVSDDPRFLISLQELHDDLASHPNAAAEARFLRMIQP
jgi:hypothetical protein